MTEDTQNICQAESEQHWQTVLKVFDALGHHVLLLDRSGIIKNANQYFLHAVGLSKADIAERHAECLEPYFPGIGDQLIELRRHCPRIFHSRLTDKNGKALLVELTLAQIEDQGRDLVICTGRNLNALTCGQEDALRRTEQQLAAANCLKRKFIANINHAVRTPMNAIIGYAEILAESGLNRQQQRFVNSIRKNGTTLVSIINDVMELSKLESGTIKVLKSAANLRAVTEQAADVFADQARAKKLAFSCTVDANLPEMYVMDANHCRQVLINLISNSIKFTDKGAVSLTVTGTETEPGSYELLFHVEDTGCGLTPEEQNALLELFGQQEELVGIHDGTRLGLTLCARLARMMGGGLHVKSSPGQGSQFLFTMPAQAAERTGQQQRLFAERKKKKQPVMLVVDDMPDMAHLIKVYFTSSPVKVLAAATSTDCLELARTEQPDMILMDLNLDGSDGRDLARQLRDQSETARIPIVAMTGLILDKESISPLFDDYLAKPFHLQELQRMVNKYIPDSTGKAKAAQARQQPHSPDAEQIRAAWSTELSAIYVKAQQSGNLEDALALGREMEQRGAAAGAEALKKMGNNMKRFALDMDIRGVEQVLTALSKVAEENE